MAENAIKNNVKNPKAEAVSQGALDRQSQDQGFQPSLGQLLRQARLDKGLGIGAVSATIRVPRHFLEAMEADRFEDLPGPPYAGGFVRAYARHLALPEGEVVNRYKCEAKPCRATPVFRLSEPPAESKLPSRSMIFAGLIVTVMGYSVWFSLAEQSVAEAVRPALPDRILPQARYQPAAALAAPQVTASDHRRQIEAILPASGGGAAVPAMAAPDASPGAPKAAKTNAGSIANRDEAMAVPGLMVEVLEDAWIHITQGERVLYTGVMEAGRRYTPETTANVVLTTGNAGGVALRIGEWTSGPLGKPGRVRRDVSLDPAAWRRQIASSDRS
ncbi:MAG: helix-turn-helix domain-containing protein [Pseudomonadota bacterium]